MTTCSPAVSPDVISVMPLAVNPIVTDRVSVAPSAVPSVLTVTLEPVYEFMMVGIGYGHPVHTHGAWLGESVVSGDRMTLPVAEPCARTGLHVQALSKATFRGADGRTEEGIGILEQLAIGPHPSGLTGLLDPFAG